MYERFTDRARMVMQLANQEAQRLNHVYIGAEHILLALVKEGKGIAAVTLVAMGLDLRRIRDRLTSGHPEHFTMGKLPLTPSAKSIVERASSEANQSGNSSVGTEHILLALLSDAFGSQFVAGLGVSVEGTRVRIFEALRTAAKSQDDTLPKAGFIALPPGQMVRFNDLQLEPASFLVKLGRLEIKATRPANVSEGSPLVASDVEILLDGKPFEVEELTLTIKARHVVMIRTNASVDY